MNEEDIKMLEEKIKLQKEAGCKMLKCKVIDKNIKLNLQLIDFKKNSIPKSKIKETILNPMKEEQDKAINEFMKKEIPHCISDGDVAQTLGYFIGKIEELLEEK